MMLGILNFRTEKTWRDQR